MYQVTVNLFRPSHFKTWIRAFVLDTMW